MDRPFALRLAVFDCDGTLVDSQHTIWAAVSAAFQSLALAPPRLEQSRRVIGLPLAEALSALAPPEAAIDHARLTERYREAFFALRARADFEEPLFPGVAQALAALEAAGCLLGIATGKSRRGLERTLERHGLLHRFVTLQTSDSGPGKPHPHMLERAIAEAGVEASACVMIGDTTFDVLMARAARAKAVGVGWGYHDVEELAAAGAHVIVRAAADLPAAVEALLP
ncbi:MAG TPA: HAD-IA family hydrolase [Alphaproteobacteria bacterium]|nr:HAD-IA family hydrolase [Alphaproteobacteria bacterium]